MVIDQTMKETRICGSYTRLEYKLASSYEGFCDEKGIEISAIKVKKDTKSTMNVPGKISKTLNKK